MRRTVLLAVVVAALVAGTGEAAAATNSGIAALQVALRAHGHYPAAVDGADGPITRSGLAAFQRAQRLPVTGRVGSRTRAALGALGSPLLGQRELAVGAVGWDVSSLEFRLLKYGLKPAALDGRFTAATAKALAAYQRTQGLPADGIAGKRTYRALAGGAGPGAGAFTPPTGRAIHLVTTGESFFSISQRYGVSPLLLAKGNGLSLATVIVPGQRLRLPAGASIRKTATVAPATPASPSDAAVRASLDHWASVYGVDPALARATAWMESGFQESVVSNVGAVGVMQLLPDTWQWVDQMLIGATTPRDYEGNIRAGVRYLRWLLDQFDGNRELALAGYYQGARAVRERGIFDDTKQYVKVILQLYGSV